VTFTDIRRLRIRVPSTVGRHRPGALDLVAICLQILYRPSLLFAARPQRVAGRHRRVRLARKRHRTRPWANRRHHDTTRVLPLRRKATTNERLDNSFGERLPG
jgi:hypothetical protein